LDFGMVGKQGVDTTMGFFGVRATEVEDRLEILNVCCMISNRLKSSYIEKFEKGMIQNSIFSE